MVLGPLKARSHSVRYAAVRVHACLRHSAAVYARQAEFCALLRSVANTHISARSAASSVNGHLVKAATPGAYLEALAYAAREN